MLQYTWAWKNLLGMTGCYCSKYFSSLWNRWRTSKYTWFSPLQWNFCVGHSKSSWFIRTEGFLAGWRRSCQETWNVDCSFGRNVNNVYYNSNKASSWNMTGSCKSDKMSAYLSAYKCMVIIWWYFIYKNMNYLIFSETWEKLSYWSNREEELRLLVS